MTNTPQIGRQLELYISSPQACDYLKDNKAKSIFISPDVNITPGIYEHLISIGFRRSGQHAYRPHCDACRACISCRLDVNQFVPSRSQKRLMAKNENLIFKPLESTFSEEYYDLYKRYQSYKHPGGSMESFGPDEYKAFLCQSFGNNIVYETRLNGQLIAVAITDVFSDALSAVYTFFDPEYSSRSIGTYNLLQQINATKQLKKKHLYLGYYIKDSLKMSYKANFRPIEMFIEGEWTSYSKRADLPVQSASLDTPLSF
ncbi:MAG: arginyltransferase [Cycloclasticus sp.]|jgi:arginine-tRNA-protein transferase|nr:arginyltransferase [Cycloclasticus sp.]HIL91229.1 arginyltransferase [Cycloclasticus sp.]